MCLNPKVTQPCCADAAAPCEQRQRVACAVWRRHCAVSSINPARLRLVGTARTRHQRTRDHTVRACCVRAFVPGVAAHSSGQRAGGIAVSAHGPKKKGRGQPLRVLCPRSAHTCGTAQLLTAWPPSSLTRCCLTTCCPRTRCAWGQPVVASSTARIPRIRRVWGQRHGHRPVSQRCCLTRGCSRTRCAWGLAVIARSCARWRGG